MAPLFLALLCLTLCSSSYVAAQRCEATNQVTAENPLQLTDLVRLLTVPIPESCGDFNPLQLLPCRDELNVISGCCMSPCVNVFRQYTTQCLLDLTEVLCANVMTTSAVELLNSIASRCNEDYTPLVCDADLPIASIEAEACACAPEHDLDELEQFLARLDEGES